MDIQQPRSVPLTMAGMDAGDPNFGAYFPDSGNRALPGPSPTANLVGIWKGKKAELRTALCRRFFIFSLSCPSQEEDICAGYVIPYEATKFCVIIGSRDKFAKSECLQIQNRMRIKKNEDFLVR
jgi:hypothetical protein